MTLSFLESEICEPCAADLIGLTSDSFCLGCRYELVYQSCGVSSVLRDLKNHHTFCDLLNLHSGCCGGAFRLSSSAFFFRRVYVVLN